MAHILSDRVKETTTTTGTGTLALLGAVAQFRAFSAVMANNDTTNYAIVGQTGTEWEVGRGTWTTGNNLARTTVLAGSNGTSLVNLSAGTKNVFMTVTPLGEWPRVLISGNTDTGIYWNAGEMSLIRPAVNTLRVVTATLQTEIPVSGRPPFQFDNTGSLDVQVAGSMGMDATNLYATTDGSNPGIVPVVNFIRANATRTYTSNTSSQAIFNDPANGRITLEVGTYRFAGLFSWTAMSATSGNRSIDILGAGTAVVATTKWIAIGFDGALGAAGAGSVTTMATVGSPASVVTATIATSLGVMVFGSFELSTAGTMIPSTTMVTAAASVLGISSWYEIERIGDTSRISVGQWS